MLYISQMAAGPSTQVAATASLPGMLQAVKQSNPAFWTRPAGGAVQVPEVLGALAPCLACCRPSGQPSTHLSEMACREALCVSHSSLRVAFSFSSACCVALSAMLSDCS